MNLCDISHDFKLISNFIDMIYVIITFIPKIHFVIHICVKEL